MYSIYALGDPRTQEVCYVGIALDVFKRYAQHLNSPHNNTVKNAWMANLKAAYLLPTLSILEKDVSEQTTAQEHEKYWICYYLGKGEPLTNIVVPIEVEHRNIPHFIQNENFTEASDEQIDCDVSLPDSEITKVSSPDYWSRKVSHHARTRGTSETGKLIAVAYAQFLKYGKKPSAIAIAEKVGMSRQAVSRHLKAMGV